MTGKKKNNKDTEWKEAKKRCPACREKLYRNIKNQEEWFTKNSLLFLIF